MTLACSEGEGKVVPVL